MRNTPTETAHKIHQGNNACHSRFLKNVFLKTIQNYKNQENKTQKMKNNTEKKETQIQNNDNRK